MRPAHASGHFTRSPAGGRRPATGHRARRDRLSLYDGALGGTPDSQGKLDFCCFGGTQSASGGATTLTTTLSGQAGYAPLGGVRPVLSRTLGYQLDFTVEIVQESHTSNDRAGFSVILLGADSRGIELGFWTNEIWAQHDDTTGVLFTHGEGVITPTTGALIDYRLIHRGDSYTLMANGAEVLTGLLRDYTAFAGFPDPYETPNSLFLGDNTTSAEGVIRLSSDVITADICADEAAGPPAFTTTVAGADVSLTWSADPANHAFEVHRATTPYFAPDAGTRLATTTSLSYTDNGGAGDPAVNHFYVVRALNYDGSQSADGDESGAFDLAITPGTRLRRARPG